MRQKDKRRKRENLHLFILTKEIAKLLRKEAFVSRRSMSDIVREAISVYFMNK